MSSNSTATESRPRPGVERLEAAPPSAWRSFAPDAVVVALLVVTAFVARRGGLPEDGLWHDDAWVATGAVRGTPSQLVVVGSGHPGFTGVLMGWSRLTGGDSWSLAVPALIAGTLGPPGLYVALRSLGYARSIGALLGAALVVADVHILYSGRVKSYVLDVLIVLALVAVVPRLARVRWRWTTGVAWTAAATMVGFVSGFALLATAVAGVVLVLQAVSDRIVRVVAVAIQGAVQVALLVAVRRTVDLDTIEEHQETLFDGHLDFDLNPLEFGPEVLKHLRRIAVVFPGGPSWWTTAIVLVALAALIGTALSRSRSVAARYLALLLLVAFVGGVLDRFPFGPAGGFELSRGERSSLWLIPVMAVGLAATLQFVRNRLERRALLRTAFDVGAATVAVVLLVGAFEDAPPYPFPGSKSATRFVERELREGDAVLITNTSVYTFAVEADSGVSLEDTPERLVGFIPDFRNPRLHPLGPYAEVPGTAEEIGALVEGANRVFVHVGIGLIAGELGTIEPTLTARGFVKARTARFGDAVVFVWRRA